MPVTICFFLSGAAALVLQVLWTRMLGHVFGATTLAVSTTLSVFMGGLALGSHVGGRIAPRLRRPLLAFAMIESLVGVYGLVVPSLFELMPALQRAVGVGLSVGPLGHGIFRFLAVTAILIAPTTAMGATLPILAEGIVSERHHTASRIGRLYAANTFGAVLGAFSAGFILIPELGLSNTVYLAAALDLAVAAIVLLLWRLSGGNSRLLVRSRREETPDEILTRLEPVEVIGVDRSTERFALAVFAFSGAAAMALEVLGTRAVGVIIGASTYSFTLILTTFLIGLASGAAFMSRRVDLVSDPVRMLAWMEVLVGVSAFAGSMLVDRLPSWVHATARAHDVTTSAVYFTNFAIAAVVTFPSTVALGTVMPLVMRILSPRSTEKVGSLVGRAYAVNTVGAIAGSFAAGFLVIPFLGVERGIGLAALVSLALGVFLAVRRRAHAVLGVAALGLALIVLGPRWNVQAWTAGLFRMYLARSVYGDGWAPSGQLVFHKDGIATTVTVERESDGIGVSLKVNGKVDASDIGDMPTQVLSGLLPVLMHDDPKRALVIGYGSGVTSGALLQAPIERLDIAEIESAVYEASNTYFRHVNHEPWKDPRTTPFVDDGRNFLLTSTDAYDIIISEPSNPWMTGAASLFSRDFFQIAERKLEPGGVFLQWLQLYELSPANIHALIRTFHSVFPNVLIFTPDPFSNDTLLVGTRDPVRVDRERLVRRLGDPKIAKELERAGIHEPGDFFGLFLLGTKQIPEFVGEGPLNTDDNALIEFGAPKDLVVYAMKDARIPFLEGIVGRRLHVAPAYFSGFDLGGEGMALIGHRLLLQGQLEDAEVFMKRAAEEGADVERSARLLRYLTEGDGQPVVVANSDTVGDARYARVVYSMTENRDEEALRLFEREKGLEDVSRAHRFLYAYLCYRRERLLDAEYLIEGVLKDEPFVGAHPEVLYYAGRIFSDRGKFPRAIQLIERFDAAIATATASVPRWGHDPLDARSRATLP